MATTNQDVFSEHIHSSSFQEEFKKHWNTREDFKNPKFEIISKPFKICRIPNFLRNEEYLENLKNELTKHNFNRLHNDLYQFERTDDLVNMSGNYIPTLYNSFLSTLTSWMERNTDIKLHRKISMSSARYHDTHHLLCHDDNMGDRRIAYILYLSKDWTEQDGGTLDLFDMDQHGAPGKVVKSLVPEYNSLVFFEVVNNSYHQVGEVMTTDAKCRWSINGWFHGPVRNDHHKQPRYEMAKNLLQPNVTDEAKLNSWITERYLLPRITKQIQKNIEEMSYAFLGDFLKQSTYQRIAKDLTSPDIDWQMIGPVDMRHYEVADEKSLPEPLREFCNLFKSISFFRLLKRYTGLDLMPEDTTVSSNARSPKMRLELQRWSAGCYTLLYDRTMLEDATDEADGADISDESINADGGFLFDTARLDDSAASSTAKNRPIRDEVHQRLKRKRIESSSEPAKNPSDKKKMMKCLDMRSDVDQKSSSGNQQTGNASEISPSRDTTKSDKLGVESASATGSLLHKSEAVNEVGEESTSAVRDGNDDDYCSSSNDEEDSVSTRDGYALDVVIQFHTTDARGMPKTEDTIDYVNPCEEQGIIVEVPQRDNHLSLAYKSPTVCRLQHYLNHLYDGYTYTLLCMYYE